MERILKVRHMVELTSKSELSKYNFSLDIKLAPCINNNNIMNVVNDLDLDIGEWHENYCNDYLNAVLSQKCRYSLKRILTCVKDGEDTTLWVNNNSQFKKALCIKSACDDLYNR